MRPRPSAAMPVLATQRSSAGPAPSGSPAGTLRAGDGGPGLRATAAATKIGSMRRNITPKIHMM